MTATVAVLLVVASANAALGVVIYATNTARRQNRQFLLLAAALSVWGFAVIGVLLAPTPPLADLMIRLASYASVFIPLAFHLLLLSIESRETTFWRLLRRARTNAIAGQVAGLLSFSPWFLRSVIVPPPGALAHGPVPVYGPPFLFQAAYLAVALLGIVALFVNRSRRFVGARRLESQFVLLGMGLAIAFGLVTNVLGPVLLQRPHFQQFGPVGMLIMNLVIAYGIATRRLMEVRQIMRSATAYVLMVLYLTVVYGVVWFSVLTATKGFVVHARDLAHLLAAVTAAFLLSPTHGRVRRFADALFVNLPMTDVRTASRRASDLVQSLDTVESLTERFSALLMDTVGSEYVTVMLREDGQFRRVASVPAALAPRTAEDVEQASHASCPFTIANDDPLIKTLATGDGPLVADAIERLPSDHALARSGQRLRQVGAAAAVTVRGKDGMEGLILLGPRRSERVYGGPEEEAMRLVAGHLAVAIENARLYTQLQDGKIYNDILVDSLVSGVIAANRDRVITTVNREAQRITGMSAEAMLHQPVTVLPQPLAQAFVRTFDTAVGARNHDLAIARGPDEQMPIQLGSSVFHGHKGDLLGALIVFSDLSLVRKLETQVRRTAHLASLGTLSAGMAHEIKNPLVTLKAFAQLLQENYDDADFRKTFTDLVGKEVNRIDAIVNQLLKFGRPAKPHLQPTSAHKVLEQALQLASLPLKKKQIRLLTHWGAALDTVHGDPNLLEQAFVNFFLNAIDAMGIGGQLGVSTEPLAPSAVAGPWGPALRGPYLRITISDTGCGIREEDLVRIFDPFFTTKDSGAGLGLSIVHGIIQEHHGLIDVESRVGRGTSFHIVLPLQLPPDDVTPPA